MSLVFSISVKLFSSSLKPVPTHLSYFKVPKAALPATLLLVSKHRMIELIRDTTIGHLMRWVSHGKLLPHAEDVDPTLWRMYISTEKSTTLEHLVVKKSHQRSSSGGKQLQKLNGKLTSATHSNEEKSTTEQQNPTPQREIHTVPKPAGTNDKAQSPPPGPEEIPHSPFEADPASEIDLNTPSLGGNIGTAGTWNTEEIQQAYADDGSPHCWSRNDTPQTRSYAGTPRNTSSTALLFTAGSTADATPQNEKLEQGWVTAAMGQEGMNVSVQEGQVDGNPALQWHSENNETTWNAVQLEAGGPNTTAAKEAAADPAADRVVNVVVWLGPHDPAVSVPHP